jgi:hypothetical protein
MTDKNDNPGETADSSIESSDDEPTTTASGPATSPTDAVDWSGVNSEGAVSSDENRVNPGKSGAGTPLFRRTILGGLAAVGLIGVTGVGTGKPSAGIPGRVERSSGAWVL